ncbi:dTMP kinase [Candidatus Nanohalococcus occultus]|uniref:Probable thymidylate kinase n=1 Tax=Candidatus Nanohalococcus occultus TaxID=2978047 RepID=A0ABY8CD86_9ARCH|nr:Thymidylate kinase [Candidatus Nanohaloarchaeota archaeon SVXNc]
MKSESYPGTFIVIEGADGAGTTTQAKKLADHLDAHYTYEPSKSKIGVKVDELISTDDSSADTVALAFAADRMVHLEEEVIPKLEKGETVVCDRYYHSSLVYQPLMGEDFEWVKSLNRSAIKPDLTVVLDVSAEEGMERVEQRGKDGNVFEQLDFQQKVVVKYRELKQLEEPIEFVDASNSKEKVFNSVKVALEDHLL